MRIVITEFMDEAAVARLRERHDVLHDAALHQDAPRLLAEAAACDALIVRNATQVRGALLAALAPRCKVVGRLGVGLDNIDVPGCERLGLAVIPATGANALSVAEYVVATAMMLLRGAYQSTAAIAAGQWPRAALGTGREAAGQTLGLVGFGTIGQMSARLARALGMRVVAHDALLPSGHPAFAAHGAQACTLDELVAQSDAISLHVPLVPETRGLFGAARIAAMKPRSVLINTARGPVVDLDAVTQALRDGHLAGAAIDVFDPEPPPDPARFQGVPGLLLTPHIAGVSAQSNTRVSELIASRVLEVLG